MKGTLYIVIPAYNEEENILNVINQWYPVIKAHSAHGTSRLVIIDDGSKDSTYHIMLEASKTRPLLLPITKENSGHGGTVLYGYKYALDNGADYVFQTDSVAEEVENVSRIVNKYRPVLETGMTQNADETLNQFLAELEAAGMGQIIKENRQQLKAWLEK